MDFCDKKRVVSGSGGRFRVALRYKYQKARKPGNPNTFWEVRTLRSLWLRFALAHEVHYRAYVDYPKALADFEQEVSHLEAIAAGSYESSIREQKEEGRC